MPIIADPKNMVAISVADPTAVKVGDIVFILAEVTQVVPSEFDIPAHAWVKRAGLIRGSIQQHCVQLDEMMVFKKAAA